MAGRVSALGFGAESLAKAIGQIAGGYLGDAAALTDDVAAGVEGDAFARALLDWIGDSSSISPESIYLESSTDLAVETAIALARRRNPNLTYRIITAVGSDHGRTGVCRTASGRPELHDGYGPMMAGFAHVPVGDIDALRAVVDEQTCGILFSPIDLGNAARPLPASYLESVREICDALDLALIIDESRLGFGAAGRPLNLAAVSEVQADAVILGGGLFAGLPGGVVVASERVAGERKCDTHRFPLLAAVATATLEQLTDHFDSVSAETATSLAESVREVVSGFEFAGEVHDVGMTIGMQTDISPDEMVAAAGELGLRWESAGESGLKLQLPPVLSDSDRELLLTRIRSAMEAIERATAQMSIGT